MKSIVLVLCMGRAKLLEWRYRERHCWIKKGTLSQSIPVGQTVKIYPTAGDTLRRGNKGMVARMDAKTTRRVASATSETEWGASNKGCPITRLNGLPFCAICQEATHALRKTSAEMLSPLSLTSDPVTPSLPHPRTKIPYTPHSFIQVQPSLESYRGPAVYLIPVTVYSDSCIRGLSSFSNHPVSQHSIARALVLSSLNGSPSACLRV